MQNCILDFFHQVWMVSKCWQNSLMPGSTLWGLQPSLGQNPSEMSSGNTLKLFVPPADLTVLTASLRENFLGETVLQAVILASCFSLSCRWSASVYYSTLCASHQAPKKDCHGLTPTGTWAPTHPTHSIKIYSSASVGRWWRRVFSCSIPSTFHLHIPAKGPSWFICILLWCFWFSNVLPLQC